MPQSNAEVEIPGVDDHATWDEEQGVFRVAIDGSAEFAAMAILPTAPLLLSHLDTSAHNKTTALGDECRPACRPSSLPPSTATAIRSAQASRCSRMSR